MNENGAQFDPAASGDELLELAVFHLEGRLSAPQRTRLNTLLAEDAGNRETFVAVCTQASLLASCAGFDGEQGDAEFEDRGSRFDVRDSGFTIGAERERSLQPEPRIPSPESPLPFHPLSSLSSLSTPLTTSHYPPATNFVGGPVFSYMVATLILGVMLLGAWAYTITHYQQVVDNHSPSAPSGYGPELVFVGRITGMKDCRWADPDTQTYIGSSVPLGRKYALSAGLMEITYDTGARVILEGPCTYQSRVRRRRLSGVGKTDGAGGGEVRGQRSEVRGQRSEVRHRGQGLILHPSSFILVFRPHSHGRRHRPGHGVRRRSGKEWRPPHRMCSAAISLRWK